VTLGFLDNLILMHIKEAVLIADVSQSDQQMRAHGNQALYEE